MTTPEKNILNIKNYLKKNKLKAWVCSYGGSGTNMLADYLQKQGVKTKNFLWHKKLVHNPEPLDLGIPMIYIYDDPRKSLFSEKTRKNIYFCNILKLSNNYFDVKKMKITHNSKKIRFCDDFLLRLMIQQFKNWTSAPFKDKILFIRFKDFFNEKTKEKLELFLNKKLTNYPVYKESKKKYNFEKKSKLFEKYKEDIDFINNYHLESSEKIIELSENP